MSRITLNTRTVVRKMFEAGGFHTNVHTVSTGRKSVDGKTELSSAGVSMSTQGSDSTVLQPINIKSIPLYIHTMLSNVGDMRRHPNQTSRVLHFTHGSYSLFASSIYQESLPNGDNTWSILASKDALAVPNKTFTFDTEMVNENLYVVSGQMLRGNPVKISNLYHNSLEFSEVQMPIKGDRSTLIVRSSPIPNHFRLIYNTYTDAGGHDPISNLTLLIDGASHSLVGWTTQEHVGIELKSSGVTKRRDTVNSVKTVIASI